MEVILLLGISLGRSSSLAREGLGVRITLAFRVYSNLFVVLIPVSVQLGSYCKCVPPSATLQERLWRIERPANLGHL
jgi:hypothetical protein